ncbi:hypothetical protein CesoFtcFv8_010250 [Champsocephalus esox]|uniref:Uncharacterized protein n=1 Tax=Champsocephalus esox TaxID=159716 RepID=A0AAN8C8K4_9TELE|nr:hypothetical protein CesoFtcFv8_010250 [Champsocephalus esox]
MVGALNKVNTSLSSSISIPFPFHTSPPLLLYRPLHTLLFRTPVQMALQSLLSQWGTAGMGGFLAPCPYHHPQSQQEPKSVLASRLNAEVQGPSQSGC